MRGGGATVSAVSRIGGNRLDSQEREQAFETFVEFVIYVSEHGVELAHGIRPFILRKLSTAPSAAKCRARNCSVDLIAGLTVIFCTFRKAMTVLALQQHALVRSWALVLRIMTIRRRNGQGA